MSKTFQRVGLCLALGLFHTCGWADEADLHLSSGFLPRSGQIFKPLLADPRELQFAVIPVAPIGHTLLGDADMGGYLGLYRWSLPGAQFMQLSVGGGAFGRFDLEGKANDMESVDFFANLPLDYRLGSWSFRGMLYHTSSHLGDDYIKTHDLVTTKHSWDNLRLLISKDLGQFLRLYGGYDYAFRTLPENIGRSELQTGFECSTGWSAQGHLKFYWANDFQSWERIHWNPEFTSQAGIKMAQDPTQGRTVSLFVEFETGGQPQGQFYLQKQTLWSLGLKFELG